MKKIFILCSVVLIFTSCEKKPAVYQYAETTVVPQEIIMDQDPHAGLNMGMAKAMDDPQINQMVQKSVANTPISWKTPDGWSEKPASGLRMATFASNDSNPIDCSITALGGGAGGLELNISRWAGQINLEISSDKLSDFINSRTPIESQSGLKGSLLDFTTLQDKKDASPSMLAAVFEIEGTSIFIKMSGTQQAIESNRQQFMQLISSLTQ